MFILHRMRVLVLETDGYAYKKPIVYYGSSVSQGGCASHAGNAYQAILSRELKCDHINLGFSVSCFGAPLMAKYIAGLDMLAFVLDYDYNATSVEHLRKMYCAKLCGQYKSTPCCRVK